MARPLYESANDRRRERAAMERLFEGTGRTVRKLPIRYGIDFAVIRDGQIVSWAEVKCRYNSSALYPTLMISAAKIWTGINLSKDTLKPFFIVAEWTDGIGFLKVTDVSVFELGFGGRTDRDDEQDVEPVYFIPIDMFKMKE